MRVNRTARRRQPWEAMMMMMTAAEHPNTERFWWVRLALLIGVLLAVAAVALTCVLMMFVGTME